MLRSGNEDEGLDEEAEPAAVAGVQVLDLVHACEKEAPSFSDDVCPEPVLIKRSFLV